MALFSADIDNLQQLFVEQLRDLYNGEQQITKALPKLIDKATSSTLKSALQEHLEVTRDQITRLESIFSELGEKPTGESCKGMEGVIDEGDHLVGKCKDNSAVIDSAIITSAQRVEHYEIAGYGTVKTFARQLGRANFAQLLETTLDEEKEADKKLTQLAETLNVQAREAA
jgi:ferritin-like metal-binding protein YciE